MPATPPRPFYVPLPLLLFLAVLLTTPLAAQSSRALEAGLLTAFEDEVLVQVGFRLTSATPRVPGVDFSVATFPEGLASGFFLFTPDLSLAFALPIDRRAWVLPRVGFSMLIAFGEGDQEWFPGYHVGVGVLGATGDRTGMRLDLTHRRWVLDGDDASMLVVSFGFAWFF
jgi:hypothetical protein